MGSWGLPTWGPQRGEGANLEDGGFSCGWSGAQFKCEKAWASKSLSNRIKMGDNTHNDGMEKPEQ